jgi:hypothetical protein
MLLSEIPRKCTRNAIERIGLTENDLRCFETLEEVQRYIYLENRRRSNEKKKQGDYFKNYYQENKERLREVSRIYKQNKRLEKKIQKVEV